MDKVPYGKRREYPHLKPADVAIWERFLEKYPNFYEAVAYDVRVGAGRPIPPGTEAALARDWEALTQWKIDVVGFNQNKADIIEIKPRAGLSAIGQARSYNRLYREYIDPEAELQPVVITDELRPDIAALALGQGIDIYVV